jgi:hypothetical protein
MHAFEDIQLVKSRSDPHAGARALRRLRLALSATSDEQVLVVDVHRTGEYGICCACVLDGSRRWREI